MLYMYDEQLNYVGNKLEKNKRLLESIKAKVCDDEKLLTEISSMRLERIRK